MLIQLQRFLKNESGAAAIEYGLLSSGIAVAVIPSVKNVGQQRPWLGSADKAGSSGSCGRLFYCGGA
jgi:Flp pilus assembly pilin Flp